MGTVALQRTVMKLMGWGWYPAGQDNMWKALELTDVSPAGGGGVRHYLVPRLANLCSQRAVLFFLDSLLNDTHCMIIG